jgi:hypothetical protein
MKTIKRISLGLISSSLLAIGLSQTAERIDPLSQSLAKLREHGGDLAGPALPCARSMGDIAGPALPCARASDTHNQQDRALPCAFQC